MSPIRSDGLETRRKLVDAVEIFLRQDRREFSLPEAARQAGVSVASAYRHFESPLELRTAYHESKIRLLVERFAELADTETGFALFTAICREWVHCALPWAVPVARTRSYEGFLQRARRDEAITSAIYGTLARTLRALMDVGVIPVQDVDYAVLAWTTLFDERLLVDLSDTLGWDENAIVEVLTAHTMAVLRAHPGPAVSWSDPPSGAPGPRVET